MKREVRPSLAQVWERISDPEHRSTFPAIEEISRLAAKAREAYENGDEHIQLTRDFLIRLTDFITGTVGLTDETIDVLRETQLLLLQISASMGDLARGAKPPFLAPTRKSGRPPATTEVLDLNQAIVSAYRRSERLWAAEGLSVRERQERIASLVRKAGASEFTWRQVRSAVSNLENLHAGYSDPEFMLELDLLLDGEAGLEGMERSFLDNIQEIAEARPLKKFKP